MAVLNREQQEEVNQRITNGKPVTGANSVTIRRGGNSTARKSFSSYNLYYHSMHCLPSFPLAESPPRDLQITAYK